MAKIKNSKLIIILVVLLILALFALVIVKHFKKDNDSLSRGLAAYWKFDETTGNIVHDASGNNNEGLLVNNPQWTEGKIGGALNLDGQDDYVKVPMTINWPQLTVSAWFKPTNLTGAGGMGNPRIICNSHTDIDNKGFQLRFDKGGDNGWVDVGNGKEHASVGWQKRLEIGKWYFYALTYDGLQVRAYLNGELLGSASLTGNIADSRLPINIGRNPAYEGDYFTGLVDEIRIYKRALSLNEIRALYKLPSNTSQNNFASLPKHEVSKTNFISLPVPLGSYSNYSLDAQSYPYGVVDRDLKEKLSLNNPLHYLAQLVWFEKSGYLEYRVKNPLPKDSRIKALNLFFEACSEVPHYDLNHKTDISLYINGKKVGIHTVNSDFGGKRGKYTPQWWPTDNSQYGKPIFVEVRQDGTYIGDSYNSDWAEKKRAEINFQKVSAVSIKDLNLNQDFITLRIGVDKDAQHRGGMNLFGKKFGNYSKMIDLGLEYEGEKIYQPKIGEIIDNPKKYENKKVILTVHPGGWSCPLGKVTGIPEAEGFSRSSTMVYDDTGCLYGSGDILLGKILVPEIHTSSTSGNETIVIEGRVKLDKNNVPFITLSSDTNK